MVKRLTRDMLAIVHEHAVQVYPSTGDIIRAKSANVSRLLTITGNAGRPVVVGGMVLMTSDVLTVQYSLSPEKRGVPSQRINVVSCF